MPTVFLYLLKFSISLAVVYLFYRVVLRRLTFYQHNRWYLLAYPLLCLAIPFIDVTPWLSNSVDSPTGVLGYVPVLHNAVPPTVNNSLTGWVMAGLILGIGSLLMLGRLVIQYISLLKIKKTASLVESNGVALYQIDKNMTPFSFANSIYININQHSQEELQEIIRHEYVHVKQRHSVDIVLAELICTLNWYNPFAWLLRHAIRQNLEFIADQQVLQSGIDKKDYQYLLLKVVGGQQFRIVNAFNFSSLKKRIAMMNRLKSAKVHLVKFTFVLPLVAVLLLAFRQQFKQKSNAANKIAATHYTDTIPDDARATAPLTANLGNIEDEQAFIKRHPEVARLEWAHVKSVRGEKPIKQGIELRTGPILYVRLTNGSQETYSLNNADDLKRFKNKYNEMPPIAPPPPPPAPRTPNAPPPPPEPPTLPTESDWEKAAPAPPTPAIAPPPPPTAPKLPASVRYLRINNNKATVELKNGKTETYDLNNAEEKKAYVAKYGELPSPPPPPPPPSMAEGAALKMAPVGLFSIPTVPAKPTNEGC